MTVGQSNKSASDVELSEIEWRRNRGRFLWTGLTAFLFLFGGFVLFSDEPSTPVNRIGQFVVWCVLVGCSTFLVVAFYYGCTLSYGISDAGIHLKTLNRIKTLHWENIETMKWSKQTSKLGAVTIRLHDGSKEGSLMVDMNAFREMNREFDRHRLKTVRQK